MMLYYYALELFAKQASTIFQRPYVDSNGKIIDFAARRKKEKEMFRKNLLEQLVQFVDKPAATMRNKSLELKGMTNYNL